MHVQYACAISRFTARTGTDKLRCSVVLFRAHYENPSVYRDVEVLFQALRDVFSLVDGSARAMVPAAKHPTHRAKQGRRAQAPSPHFAAVLHASRRNLEGWVAQGSCRRDLLHVTWMLTAGSMI